MDAAWGEQRYEEPKSNRIKYGTVPHIGLEFFGLGRNYNPIPIRRCWSLLTNFDLFPH